MTYENPYDQPDDLVTHIKEPETKEEPMKDTVTVVVIDENVNATKEVKPEWVIKLTHAQIEAAHAEMVRQKAENAIKVGDIVKPKGSKFMFIASQEIGDRFSPQPGTSYYKTNLEKVTGTPEFIAQLRAVLEGK